MLEITGANLPRRHNRGCGGFFGHTAFFRTEHSHRQHMQHFFIMYGACYWTPESLFISGTSDCKIYPTCFMYVPYAVTMFSDPVINMTADRQRRLYHLRCCDHASESWYPNTMG